MIRRVLARVRCDWFGHCWTAWSDWESDGFVGLQHERSCTRCPAVEVQRDGEQGVVHV
jgi:hypothetical protein